MCDYKLPGWPSTNIHRDEESMSHTASAVEAAGHRVWRMFRVRGTSVCLTSCSVKHTLSLHKYTNWEWLDLEGNPCVLTEWSGTLQRHLVLWPLTFHTPVHLVGRRVKQHPLVMSKSPASCRLPCSYLSRNLAICVFVCVCPHRFSCYIKFHCHNWLDDTTCNAVKPLHITGRGKI